MQKDNLIFSCKKIRRIYKTTRTVRKTSFFQTGTFFLASIFIIGLCFLSCKKNQTAAEKPCIIKFSWWGNEKRHEYTLKGIETFESQNPNIKIEPQYDSWGNYEKNFEQNLNSAECADVMQINFDWLSDYSKDGTGFYDINELSDYIDLYNYTLDDLSYGTINDKLNAIPVAFNTAIPVYNKTLLDENKLEIPATWDELFDAAKVLKQKDMYVFTLSNRLLFFVAIAWFEQTYSKEVFLQDQKLNVSEAEIELILDFVKRLVDEHVVYSPTQGIKLSSLKEKKVAGAVLWCNEVSVFIDEIEASGGQAVLGNFIQTPGATKSGWYLKPVMLYAIKKDCKNPKEAAIFLNYLLNDKEFALLQKSDKGVPASNKALTSLMENSMLSNLQYSALMKMRFNSGSINKMLPVMENSTIIKIFSDGAFDYVNEIKSLSQVAREILQEIE